MEKEDKIEGYKERQGKEGWIREKRTRGRWQGRGERGKKTRGKGTKHGRKED